MSTESPTRRAEPGTQDAMLDPELGDLRREADRTGFCRGEDYPVLVVSDSPDDYANAASDGKRSSYYSQLAEEFGKCQISVLPRGKTM
jgi:hypothetical protein